MTDRDLLELAAKAAGLELRFHPDGTAYSDSRAAGYWAVWNPLTDDGDALRLAVKLEMNVFQAAGSAYALPSDDDGSNEERVRYSEAGNDPAAATRRAIVRAAAEIGRAMG